MDKAYTPREIPQKQFGNNMTDDYFVTAIYEPSEKYKLVEEYGTDSFVVMDDGRLYTRWGFTDSDEAVLWFLGFGDKVEVINPLEMVEKMKTTVGKIMGKYER